MMLKDTVICSRKKRDEWKIKYKTHTHIWNKVGGINNKLNIAKEDIAEWKEQTETIS